MAWTKLKIAALAGAGLLLARGTAVIALKTPRADAPDPAAEKVLDLCLKAITAERSQAEIKEALIQVMTSHPPTAAIRLTRLPPMGQMGINPRGRVQGLMVPEGRIEVGAGPADVLRFAYNLDPKFPYNRIIVPRVLAYSRYDFIDTKPHGGREVLQQALQDQSGLVARREMRQNLVLTVKNPAAAGLHKHNDGRAGGTSGFKSRNITMAELALGLGKSLGVAVTDQTGLAGGFDYSLDMPYPPAFDDIKKALLDQLGLELIPAADNQPVEFLVTEKIR